MSEYREPRLVCPTCATPLEPREVGDAVVDLCPGCAGLWIDWFDGELVTLARKAPTIVAEGSKSRGGGANECPRCRSKLHDETFGGAEVHILRCGDCAGAFITRDACDRLIGERTTTIGEGPDESWLEKLVAALKDLLF